MSGFVAVVLFETKNRHDACVLFVCVGPAVIARRPVVMPFDYERWPCKPPAAPGLVVYYCLKLQ